jgi:carbonic anhydrase/acetyltransferase-like protein (isoleucine patch superfamily)
MIYSLNSVQPELRAGSYVAPSAEVIGSVVLQEGASVWFQAVVRGDTDLIVLGRNSNIQDGSVLHTDEGIELRVGPDVTVGHRVVLHGCKIGAGSMIGMGAVILNGAEIGENCLVAASSLVPSGRRIPDNSVVMGSPGKVVRETGQEEREMMRETVGIYVRRSQRYRRELQRLDPAGGPPAE